MASTASEKVYNVDVIFDSGTKQFSFGGDMKSGELFIAGGVDLIRFSLVTKGGSPGNAVFPSSPLSWQAGQPQITGKTVTDTSIELEISNVKSHEDPEPFPFELTVMYDGQPFTSPDPTIINEPHEGGVPSAVPTLRVSSAEVAPAGVELRG
jgi:hypothetical protein